MALVQDSAKLEACQRSKPRAPTTTADFVIHTGNVQRCNHLQALVHATFQREVLTALKCTMQCWKKHNQGDFVMSREVIGHPKLMRVPLPGNDHAKRVRVKLFLLDSYEEGTASKALSGVEKAVGVASVDEVIIDAKHHHPHQQSQSQSQSQSQVKGADADLLAAWREVETLHDYGLVKSLGVSDLSLQQLQRIQDAAKVPVSIGEVTLDPEAAPDAAASASELREFARKHNINLVAHSDTGMPLPKAQFQRIMNKVIKGQSVFTPAPDLAAAHHYSSSASSGSSAPCSSACSSSTCSSALRVDWTPRWMARYTVVDTERSVVESTGYVIGGRYTV